MSEKKFQKIINGKDKEIRAINNKTNFSTLDNILFKKRNLLNKWDGGTVDLRKISDETQAAFRNYLTTIIAAVEDRIAELKRNISEGNNKPINKGDMIKKMGNFVRGAGKMFNKKLGNRNPRHTKYKL